MVLYNSDTEYKLCTNTPNGFDEEDKSDFINFNFKRRSILSAELIFNLPQYARISELDLFYEFYGRCYQDAHKPFQILNLAQKEDSHLTVQKCVEFCAENNAEYAGLSNGNTCQCGNGKRVRQLAHTIIDSSECNIKCAGDDTKICGGSDLKMNIFSCIPDWDCKTA